MRLDELFPPNDLTTAIDAGHVTRKPHPELPLSIYTYTPAVEIVHRLLTSSLPADPRAFNVEDEHYSGALRALYDVLSQHAWAAIKPDAIGPRTSEDN